jgi:hypothetical protein
LQRQDQVSFLDGHVRAFDHFGAVPQRIAYDNLKSAVVKILVGSERELTRDRSAPGKRILPSLSASRPRSCGAASSSRRGSGPLALGSPRSARAHPPPPPSARRRAARYPPDGTHYGGLTEFETRLPTVSGDLLRNLVAMKPTNPRFRIGTYTLTPVNFHDVEGSPSCYPNEIADGAEKCLRFDAGSRKRQRQPLRAPGRRWQDRGRAPGGPGDLPEPQLAGNPLSTPRTRTVGVDGWLYAH